MGIAVYLLHPKDSWQSAHDAVVEAIGKVTVEYDPHVTLVYMGDALQSSKRADIVNAVKEALDGIRPIKMSGEGIGTFPPTEQSEGRTPVLIKYEVTDHLEDVQVRLLRALAPYVHAKQFLDFKAHATIGFAEGSLSTKDRLALGKLSVGEEDWTADTVIVSDNGKVIGQVKLNGIAKRAKADSVSPKPGMEVKDLNEKQLIGLHWDLHMMFRRELSDDLEGWDEGQLATLHAHVVDTLFKKGVKHPPPPDDGLDADSQEEEDNAPKNIDYTTEPDYRDVKSKSLGSEDSFQPGVMQFKADGDYPLAAREELYQRAVELHTLNGDLDADSIGDTAA